MKKAVIVFCLLALLPSSMVFARSEKKGTIMGTFGIGGGVGTVVETASQISFILDLNLINQTGLTLCLTNIVSVRSGALGPSQNIMFGIGYTYVRDKWNIGVSGIVTYRQTIGIVSDLSMFDVFAGISLRFF